MCFGQMWMTFKSLVDVLNCMFGDDPNAIDNIHESSPPNEYPREVYILGKGEDNMQEFIQDSLRNLENNASFYPSMQQSTLPIIPSLDMFNLLHPKVESQSKPQPSIRMMITLILFDPIPIELMIHSST